MTTFLLLRHGTRVNRQEDTLLSAVGIKQAEQTARYLSVHPITAIYASPLPRTQQTAAILSAHLKIPVFTEDRLQERMIYDGRLGETFEEFLTEWDKTMADREYQPFYGVSAWQSGERFRSVLDELAEDKTFVIVSHGGSIGDVLRNLFSDQPLTFRTDPASGVKWVEILECSVTEISRQDGKYELKRFNDTWHLQDLSVK